MKRTITLLLALIFSISLGGDVYALTPSQLFALENDSLYYQGSSGCNNASSSASGSGIAINLSTTGTAAWPNVAGPYYLEKFAINVLEDLAKTTNTPVANVLTKEHVIELVGWFWSEGGNILNTNLFNPLDSDQLEPGSTYQSTGDEAYASFSSGVQATTQVFISSYQNRVGNIFIDPTSSIPQVASAITYYQNYAGNKAWASADNINVSGAQQAYYDFLVACMEQATLNYDQEAAIELGSPPLQEATNTHVPYSDLVYGSANPPASSIAGSAANNSGQCVSSSTINPSPGSSTGYKNPLRSVSSLRVERVDQGVDYAGQGPVYAIGDGTIENITNTGWNFGGYDAFITELLSNGSAKGDYVYVAEGCVPVASLTIGETVTPNTVICNMIDPSSTGIETGWAQPPGDGAALAFSQWNNYNSTAYGANYNQLLIKLGAPSGVLHPPIEGSLPPNWPTW